MPAVSLATRSPGGGDLFPVITRATSSHTLEWTGSLGLNTYHYQCGGKLRKLSGYNRLSVSSLRKISNFVIIIFGTEWLGSTLSNPPQPLLGKTENREDLDDTFLLLLQCGT